MNRRVSASLLFVALTGCGFFQDPKEPSATASTAAQSLPANASVMTAAQWLDLSMSYYKQSRFMEAIAAAQTAIYLKPDLPEAYNNIGAAYGALRLWEPAVQADAQAIRLRPDFQLAKNNLTWAMEQKRLAAH